MEASVKPTLNVADLFEIVARAVPERTAIVAGDRRLTYRELDERGSRFARHLLEAGIQPGAKVGILSWNRAEWMECFYGAMKARAVPINVNYRYTADELRYVLADADVEVLVYERSFAPVVAKIRGDLPELREELVLSDGSGEEAGDAVAYEEALASGSGEPPGIERSPDDLYILYTGGTTGMPKGVMWRQEDIFYAALFGGAALGGEPISTPEEILDRIAPEESSPRAMIVAPLMHGAAQWATMIMTLAGGCVVLYTDRGFDPHAVWRLVEREKCNTMAIVGDAMGRPLAEALADPNTSYDTSTLFHIGSGGAVFSRSVQDQFKQLLPNAIILDTFGASETGANGMAAGEASRRFSVNPETNVLGDDLRPVAPGSGDIGRLARRGHIPLGYHKDEKKTAATFVTDPDGVRWVIPGDFATVEEDGTITVLGRGSQCINTGGEKVYPEEVEEALKSHEAVFDVLVVGVPDDRFGERVAAVLQPRPGGQPTLEDLQAHCRDRIAGYKVPRELKLVDAVKRTPAGKADYRWAKAQFGDGGG